jgi:uncharacterized protein (TIGR00661 family)
MNILYGVCGDGMGHAMRSAVLARHLEEAGHDVTFVSHDGAAQYLSRRTRLHVIHVVGMHSKITHNAVSPIGTILMNAMRLSTGATANMVASIEMMTRLPDVVITDFEPASANYAMLMSKPLLAVDNVHFLNHCKHPPALLASDYSAAALMYQICENLIPAARRYLITTFAAAPVTRPTTSLHLPILRNEILAAKQSVATSEHVVAYFNDKADHAMLAKVFRQVGVPIHLYGSRGRRHQEGNVTFCRFSDEEFIEDVASCRAVIGGSGFTFMTEAIFLGKPMLALPYEMQFEQILNANYLAALGYGERCRKLTSESVRAFLGQVPRYAEKLREFRHDGNRGLFASVDQALLAVA